MLVKSGLALTICTPMAPFKSPVATPNVVGVPSITPNPPRLVKIAPPTVVQCGFWANPLGDAAPIRSPRLKRKAKTRVVRVINPPLWVRPRLRHVPQPVLSSTAKLETGGPNSHISPRLHDAPKMACLRVLVNELEESAR